MTAKCFVDIAGVCKPAHLLGAATALANNAPFPFEHLHAELMDRLPAFCANLFLRPVGKLQVAMCAILHLLGARQGTEVRALALCQVLHGNILRKPKEFKLKTCEEGDK